MSTKQTTMSIKEIDQAILDFTSRLKFIRAYDQMDALRAYLQHLFDTKQEPRVTQDAQQQQEKRSSHLTDSVHASHPAHHASAAHQPTQSTPFEAPQSANHAAHHSKGADYLCRHPKEQLFPKNLNQPLQLSPIQQVRLNLLVDLKEGKAMVQIIENAKFEPKRTEHEFMVSRFQTLEVLTQWILEGRVPDLEQPSHGIAHTAQTNNADSLSAAHSQQST